MSTNSVPRPDGPPCTLLHVPVLGQVLEERVELVDVGDAGALVDAHLVVPVLHPGGRRHNSEFHT